ncbi:MAG: ATP-grasp domain-containing protein [Actinobacteria bacterium]|nr:ATP-grasp domain-containing protein [Actinomycetota bacterium]
MFAKVLIANRGEIARRVVRTCRELGVATVAVYSDADAHEPHVHEADEAVRLGPAPAAESYLNVQRIVAAAVRTAVEAVHPGYGFLAENADLAQACEDKGVVFVGPRPATLRLVGNKAAAKRSAQGAGIPVIPGVHDPDLDDGALVAAAQAVGYPLLVKAVAGGGGRGLRRVDRPGDVADALVAARQESRAAFGDDRLFLEKLVQRPRHIEIQIFGDRHGDVVHLFERECSVQRRYQKLVEEAPSPALDEDLRQAMAEAAVAAARSVDYVGAGTVELLLSDVSRDFWFLEMNARLQVEHPVTEAITGIDLVEWQLRIAAGQPLPLRQDELSRDGHAIEARVYAEDPARGHLPQTGRILTFDVPASPGVRVDAGVVPGSRVTPHYDALLAKLIVHGRSRREAVARMRRLLADTSVLGVTTNVAFLHDIIDHGAFTAAALTTAFLHDHLRGWVPPAPPVEALAAAAAALVRRGAGHGRGGDPWETLGPWRVAGVGGWRVTLRDDRGTAHALVVGGRGDRLRVQVGGSSHDVVVTADEPLLNRLDLEVDGREAATRVAIDVSDRPHGEGGEVVWVHTSGVTTWFGVVAPTRHPQRRLLTAGAALTSPMPGTVTSVPVTAGDHVDGGQVLVTVEAMKVQHPVRAPAPGTVTAVRVAAGDVVDADQPLVEVGPDMEGDGG